ncbi:MAG: thioredoxin family protein [Bilophila wadsworthia]
MNGSSPTTALSCSTKALPALQVMRTVLGKATTERPDIQLASVDSEEQPDLMARCSVERVPT